MISYSQNKKLLQTHRLSSLISENEELLMIEFSENIALLIRKERCIKRNITIAKMCGDEEDVAFYEEQLINLRNVGSTGYETLSLKGTREVTDTLEAQLLELEQV